MICYSLIGSKFYARITNKHLSTKILLEMTHNFIDYQVFLLLIVIAPTILK